MHTPVFEVGFGLQNEGPVEADFGIKVGPILTNCWKDLTGTAVSIGVDLDLANSLKPGYGVDLGVTFPATGSGGLISVDLFGGISFKNGPSKGWIASGGTADGDYSIYIMPASGIPTTKDTKFWGQGTCPP